MSKKPEWFIIDDLDKLVESTRVLVFDQFNKTNEDMGDDITLFMNELSIEEVEELDQVLSQQECLSIAKSLVKVQTNRKTKKIRYVLNDKQYMEMIESFNSRMISNILHGLVKKGIVDSTYDPELNDFVFWLPDNDEKENQKPETD